MSSHRPVSLTGRTLFFLLLSISVYANGQQLTAGSLIPSKEEIAVLALRVRFPEDGDASTTGPGAFLLVPDTSSCGGYTLDPPPHDRAYLASHLRAVDHYFRTVSHGSFGLDLDGSAILPQNDTSSYQVPRPMKDYHPFGADSAEQELMTARFFQEALEVAFSRDSIRFGDFDLVIIFHAGIGQDFSLPFLDPTPEDLPSAFIDSSFLVETLGVPAITFGDGSSVSRGILVPETQNHLLFSETAAIFAGSEEPCDYQFALTGTLALLIGSSIGLPELWDTGSGRSGAGVFALMDQGSNNGRGAIPSPPDAWSRIAAGWETSAIIPFGSQVSLSSRHLAANAIARVPITAKEYFLIENRNNWIRPGVDLDSLRWANRDGSGRLPSTVEILLDSSGVERDPATGVVIAAPNYDLGLPGSGLLIWHIDEEAIELGLPSHSVNGNPDRRGIDLEEADGAEDLGVPSLLPFFDASSGWWADLWYEGNLEYAFANPGHLDSRPTFGPNSFPDTRSTDGAETFVFIGDIGSPGYEMSFSVSNSRLAPAFPDTSLHLRLQAELALGGLPEIVGGNDTLWWSHSDSLIRRPFHKVRGSSVQLAFLNEGSEPGQLAVVEFEADSVRVFVYAYDAGEDSLTLSWLQTVQASPHSHVMDDSASNGVILVWSCNELLVHPAGTEMADLEVCPFLFDRSIRGAVTDAATGSIDVFSASIDTSSKLWVNDSAIAAGDSFVSLSAGDIDLDGSVDVLAIKADGTIHAYDLNGISKSGFPISLGARPPILVSDLLGDDHPEIVVQQGDGPVDIVDGKGERVVTLAVSPTDTLRFLCRFAQGVAAVATSSSIWMFDSTGSSNGIAWTHPHGDAAATRSLYVTLARRAPDQDELFDDERSYCYPNPVLDGSPARFRVVVESAERIEVALYDAAGFKSTTLVEKNLVPGETVELVWDTSRVESGLYLARVSGTRGGEVQTKVMRVMVIR